MAAPCTFVIFGITGDLAARKLMPAIFELHKRGALHSETKLVGYSRRDWDDAKLRDEIEKALKKFAPKAFDKEKVETRSPRAFRLSRVVTTMTPALTNFLLIWTNLAFPTASFTPRLRRAPTAASSSTWGGRALTAVKHQGGGWVRLVD